MNLVGPCPLSRRMPARLSGVLLALAVVFLLPSAANAAIVNITVGNNFFSPSSPTINQGDTVVWTWNSGGVQHSVTSGTCAGPCTADGQFGSMIKGSGTFSHTFSAPGVFPYFCIPHGSSMTGSITVQPANPLTCNPMADKPVGNQPLTVQFMANPGGGAPPYTFSWDFDDGTGANTNQNPQHTFDTIQTYNVTLTVTDSTAASHECMTQVIVTDLVCSATADPNSGDFPLDVTLTGSATGGDPNYMFMWDLADGSPMPMGEVVMHTYATPGTRHVMLMVTDSMQVPCAAPVVVQVTDPNCPAGDGDADGVCDSADNCPGTYNATQADTDLDGFGDACDDCPADPDPNQVDTDGDGEGDECQLTITNPLDMSPFTECNAVPTGQITLNWTPDEYDRFRVFISWDSNFTRRMVLNSGDRLLKNNFYIVPVKKMRRACKNALGAGTDQLFFKIFGKKRGTKLTDFSQVVEVDLIP